jgi:(heptosyl)LPS beta-1,4-glucosyltransferase
VSEATISAVLNTLDEERRLPFALRSVAPWVDEIVVVDMQSTDRTVEIARAFGARIATHARTGFVEPARAFACAQATGDWILVLDADEVVPPALARRLRAVAAHDEADVVRLSRLNHLLGAPVRHSGWNPVRDRQTRFWRNGAVTQPAEIHGHAAPRPGMRVLDLPPRDDECLLHLSHVDVAAFVSKLDAYTSVEAAQAFARGERPSAARALRVAAREWLARYVRHGGWRDGWRGFHLSLLMAGYRITAAAKLAELWDVGGRETAQARYDLAAERALAGYESVADDDVRSTGRSARHATTAALGGAAADDGAASGGTATRDAPPHAPARRTDDGADGER